MPELAEVAYHSKQWIPGFRKKISKIFINGSARCARDLEVESVKQFLVGQQVESRETHGKQMLFRFSGNNWLGVHLGMTGKLSYREENKKPTKHEHLVLALLDGQLVFEDPRQFGKLEFHHGSEAPSWWSDLPPQILSNAFTFEYFQRFCHRRKGMVVKSFLLLQESFPGVGNWMADEILWRSRIDPRRRVSSLSKEERKALYRALLFVCRGAMKYVANDYGEFPQGWLFYARWKDGGICPKTKRELKREQIGGRTTCWSPAWQK